MRLRIAFVLSLLAGPALAQQNYQGFFQPLPSTPGLSVTATATSSVVVPNGQNGGPGQARYVAIKNDCASALHFDLNFINNSTTQHYPIRLGASESFSAPMSVTSVAASPASGNSTSCTFTLVLGR